MKPYPVDFHRISTRGPVKTGFDGAMFWMTTPYQNAYFNRFDAPICSYIELPATFRLPLRIDMTVKLNAPSLYVMLGKGHISFPGDWIDNRNLGDILHPDPTKPHSFYSQVELNRFVPLSITYDPRYMAIQVDGELRYFSTREKYMKSPAFPEQNEAGFPLRLAADKHTTLWIKSMAVTEYDQPQAIPSIEGASLRPAILSVDRKAKSTLEECIAELSPALQGEILGMDAYLLGNKALKIRRKIEGTAKASKISYVSAHGFSYSARISENRMDHFFWWYMVSNHTYGEFMGRKADRTEETLQRVNAESPELARRLYGYYADCLRCHTHCSAKTIYAFAGKRKAFCHGKMAMNMTPGTFRDFREMMQAVESLIAGQA